MKKERVLVSSKQYAQKRETALVYANALFWLNSESDAKTNQTHAINEIQEMKAKMLADTTARKVETDKESQVRPRPVSICSTNPWPKKKNQISETYSIMLGKGTSPPISRRCHSLQGSRTIEQTPNIWSNIEKGMIDFQTGVEAGIENNWGLNNDSFSNHQSQSFLDVDPVKTFIETGAILKELAGTE